MYVGFSMPCCFTAEMLILGQTEVDHFYFIDFYFKNEACRVGQMYVSFSMPRIVSLRKCPFLVKLEEEEAL